MKQTLAERLTSAALLLAGLASVLIITLSSCHPNPVLTVPPVAKGSAK